MRARAAAVILAAGVVGFAVPAWSHSPGGGHTGGSRLGVSSGRPMVGGHGGLRGPSGSFRGPGALHAPGVTTHRVGGNPGWRGQPNRGGHYPGGGRYHGGGFYHGGRYYRGGGLYGWGPGFGWGGYLGLGWPFGWGGYWGSWGSPWYGWPAYYGSGYYGPAYDGAGVDQLTAVDTDVSPERALVVLNGTVIGTADDFDGFPDYLYLEPGHYTIEFRMPGYVSESRELDAGGAGRIPIDLTLQPDDSGGAEAPYQAPEGLPYGRVFGPAVGKAESHQQPGPDISLRPELQRRAGGRAAPASQLPVAPSGAIAALKLQIAPPDAAVYLDDAFLGLARDLARMQRGVAVAPGPHTIEVMAPGHAPKRVEVQAEAGKESQVTVELE